METDTTFQEVPASIRDQLVEDRVLLRVYYKSGSYMTYQAEGEHSVQQEMSPLPREQRVVGSTISPRRALSLSLKMCCLWIKFTIVLHKCAP